MIVFNQLNFKIWSKLGQRGAFFGVAIFEVVNEFPNAIVVTADLAYLSGLERFINSHNDKYVNVGIAEQNMLGISAGLAQEGNIVFATTYATFLTMRSCEQVRHYLGYMESNVKLVGTGAGLIMTYSGNTHYTFEDLSIIRAIPNIVILSPADATEAVKVALASSKYYGPVYIRLTGGLNNPMVYHDDYEFEIGKGVEIKSITDITIFATGTMVYYSIKAAEFLNEMGFNIGVVNIHTIKPIDRQIIERACNISKLIVSVEEHSVIGGLGASIAEVISEKKSSPPLLRLGIEDKFRHAGDYEYLLKENGLTPEQIVDKIVEQIKLIDESYV
jgi:transketolase